MSLLCRWCVIAGLLLGLLVLPVLAKDQPSGGNRKEFLLRYHRLPGVTQEFYTSGQYLEAGNRPARLQAEPAYRSRQPLYWALHLGVKKEAFTLVLDSSRGEKRNYDVLHVDADGDGRLTPAERLVGARSPSGLTFGPVKFEVDCGPEKCPQWFFFVVLESDTEEGAVRCRLYATNAGYYTGVVQFGSEKRQVVVADNNGNGLYHDLVTEDEWEADRVWLLDRDGKLDGTHRSPQAQPLTRWLEVGGRYWQVEVAPDGSALTVEPLDLPLGTLRSDLHEYTVLLRSGEGTLRVHGKDGTARVPAGKYQLLQCAYRAPRGSERHLQFTADAPEKGFAVQIPAGGTAEVPFGPPLVPRVVVSAAGAGELNLDLDLRGRGGERYREVSYNGSSRPLPAQVEIQDANGRRLTLLDFHYG